MITDVVMPQMGLEVVEATVIVVLVQVDDEVAAGDGMVEVETDKATTAVDAPRSGHVLSIDVSAGDVVPVGALLARIGDEPGERDGETTTAASASRPEPASDPRLVVAAAANGSAAGERRRVAPVARRAAADLGVELDRVTGTGPRGRITLRDVQQAAASSPAPAREPTPPPSAPSLEPLTRVRRTIARRMTASQLIPQYAVERDIDASHLLAQKEAMAAASRRASIGVSDLLVQAIAATVALSPALSSVYVDDPEPSLRQAGELGVGLAVATDRGLVVPVIRRPDEIGLASIAGQRSALVGAARKGQLSPDDMTGATVTLSNLGGFGVDRFAAMLNPGESAIVAVGRTTDRVVPRGRGLAIIPVMTITMTFDHRSVDGAVGGAALSTLADLLEGGMTWRP